MALECVLGSEFILGPCGRTIQSVCMPLHAALLTTGSIRHHVSLTSSTDHTISAGDFK